ncbi:TraK domain-containing protein [Pelomicrobium methylotrophicum]|uniref:TraK domain-containing protein n=1 Tax=Pelomicrobium methylotrophicum TaxID=2602750 RepID=UPI001969B6A3|nr:type-F conjugative transfer system secretin TraK [Pelomicrobium methylotrophicum]
MATLLLGSLESGAVQVLQGRPDETLSAMVSRGEPTMIRVEGRKIRRIFGAEGEFTVSADRETGVAFIRPAADKEVFSAFVADDTGRTWKLLLSVSDVPAETIVLRDRSAHAKGDRNARDESRNREIKRLILALESGGEDQGVREVNEIVPLWKEAMFVLVKVVDGPLRGEKYMLTNVSDKPMVIDERELYRRGVVAVSVERPELKPAETTAVYVVVSEN